MTSGDDPRERADGWFDILETTTINGLQALLDSIGTLHARLIAGDTGLGGLARATLLATNATGMPRDTVQPLGRWTENRWDAANPQSHLYRGELGVRTDDDGSVDVYAIRCLPPAWEPYPCPDDRRRRLYIRETLTGWTLPLPRRCVVIWRMADHGAFIELFIQHAGAFHHDLNRWRDLYDVHQPVDPKHLDMIIRRDEPLLQAMINGWKVTI